MDQRHVCVTGHAALTSFTFGDRPRSTRGVVDVFISLPGLIDGSGTPRRRSRPSRTVAQAPTAASSVLSAERRRGSGRCEREARQAARRRTITNSQLIHQTKPIGAMPNIIVGSSRESFTTDPASGNPVVVVANDRRSRDEGPAVHHRVDGPPPTPRSSARAAARAATARGTGSRDGDLRGRSTVRRRARRALVDDKHRA